jgi:hypothetical protein
MQTRNRNFTYADLIQPKSENDLLIPALNESAEQGEFSSPEYRQVIGERIEQGLESARQGRVVEGEAVFARIEGELAELERSGRE